mgnify:CR=1 FL=1
MSERTERFKKRQAKRAVRKESSHIKDLGSSSAVQELLPEKVDHNLADSILLKSEIKYTSEVSSTEVSELLDLLDKGLSTEKYSILFDSTKDIVIEQLLRPLGISRKDLASNDVDGGPVTTLNNFKQGVTANASDAEKYNSLNDFNRKDYENKDFKANRKKALQGDELKDGYTGKTIPKDGRSHLDHITSAHEIESDPMANLAMSKEERVEMANSSDNLTMTNSSLNQSKSDKDAAEWNDALNAKDKSKTNAEAYDTKEELINDKHKKSKGHIKSTRDAKYHKKLATETLNTSLDAGKEMALQQAIGSLFSDFISSVFSEVKDIFINGFTGEMDDSFWAALKRRLKNIALKVVGNWDSVINSLQSGLMGAISGFLSNLSTVIINLLVKTSKNMVRLIREGLMSLTKALKLMVNPPEGMSLKEAAHEASKLLGAGIIVSMGIFAEEAISSYLSTFAIPFSDIISVVVSGILTGLGSIVFVFILDKMDLFGVNADERHKFIMGELNNRIDDDMEQAEEVIGRLGLA